MNPERASQIRVWQFLLFCIWLIILGMVIGMCLILGRQ